MRLLLPYLLIAGLMSGSPLARANDGDSGCDSSCYTFVIISFPVILSDQSSLHGSEDTDAVGPAGPGLAEQDYRIRAVKENGRQFALTLQPLDQEAPELVLRLEDHATSPVRDDWAGKTVHASATEYGWTLREPGTTQPPLLMLLERHELQLGQISRIE